MGGAELPDAARHSVGGGGGVSRKARGCQDRSIRLRATSGPTRGGKRAPHLRPGPQPELSPVSVSSASPRFCARTSPHRTHPRSRHGLRARLPPAAPGRQHVATPSPVSTPGPAPSFSPAQNPGGRVLHSLCGTSRLSFCSELGSRRATSDAALVTATRTWARVSVVHRLRGAHGCACVRPGVGVAAEVSWAGRLPSLPPALTPGLREGVPALLLSGTTGRALSWVPVPTWAALSAWGGWLRARRPENSRPFPGCQGVRIRCRMMQARIKPAAVTQAPAAASGINLGGKCSSSSSRGARRPSELRLRGRRFVSEPGIDCALP